MATALWRACWNLSTKRIRLVVAYDGTQFCGWAPQAGLRSVQSTLTETVRQVSGEDCEIIGASRTDAGAHALGQVCHFDVSIKMPGENWTRALNDLLDEDIAVQSSKQVTPAFHSRFSARNRTYRYRIVSGVRNPVLDRHSHWEWRELDVETMRVAAANLVGRHDFRAYTAELQPWITNTWRELYKIDIRQQGRQTDIVITGTAFMRGMMRRIAGGLLEVGIGRRPETDLGSLLTEEGAIRLDWPVVLPAKGLTLLKVGYGRRMRDLRLEDDE